MSSRNLIPAEPEVSIHFRRTIRIVVMGSCYVGKTAIISRFINSSFPKKYEPTIEDLYRLTVNEVDLEILDTSGSYEFPAMRELAIAKGHAFILVYEVENEESFETARVLKDQIRQMRQYTAPITVIANKTDFEVYRNRQKGENITVRCDWECEFHRISARFSSQREISTVFEDIICHETISQTLQRTPNLSEGRYVSYYILRKRLFGGSNNKIGGREGKKTKHAVATSRQPVEGHTSSSQSPKTPSFKKRITRCCLL